MKSGETRAPERRASLGLVDRVKLAAVVVGGIGVWLWAYESVGAYASRLPAHDFSTPDVPYAQLALASAQRVLSARRVAALAPD